MIRFFLSTIILILLSSCSSPKFYKELEGLNAKKMKYNNAYRKHLKEHSKDLKKTNDIIYYYSSRINISDFKLESFHIIYDFENNIYYSSKYIDSKKVFQEKSNKIEGIDLNKNIRFFIEGKCDSLKLNVAEFNDNVSLSPARVVIYNLKLGNVEKSYKCDSDSNLPN